MPINKERYPPDWDARSARIRQRDNHTCQHCGYEAGLEDEEGRVRTLTVAHLDHDESNWEVSDHRLTTLCDACHLRYDAGDNATRRKYGKYYKDNLGNLFDNQ